MCQVSGLGYISGTRTATDVKLNIISSVLSYLSFWNIFFMTSLYEEAVYLEKIKFDYMIRQDRTAGWR